MTEPQRTSDGWNEWSRYVLAELKRMNDAIIALTAALTVLREDFVKQNARLTSLEEGLETLMSKPPSRLAQIASETAIKWAVMFGIGLLAWAAYQYINSGFKLP